MLCGDGVGMEKNSWGWNGNGADFQYRVTLYSRIEFACFSFHVGLPFYQLFDFCSASCGT